jgi:glucose-1-phosphate thymidylyltransferase
LLLGRLAVKPLFVSKMKVVIPVAGAGTRLRPHTYTQPKPLMPVAGKPIIRLIVDKLVEAGLTEFVFEIGRAHV